MKLSLDRHFSLIRFSSLKPVQVVSPLWEVMVVTFTFFSACRWISLSRLHQVLFEIRLPSYWSALVRMLTSNLSVNSFILPLEFVSLSYLLFILNRHKIKNIIHIWHEPFVYNGTSPGKFVNEITVLIPFLPQGLKSPAANLLFLHVNYSGVSSHRSGSLATRSQRGILKFQDRLLRVVGTLQGVPYREVSVIYSLRA